MEITRREIIASVSILAIMLIIGVLIHGSISDTIMDNNAKYNKALKITDQELFEYGMSTNVGNAFVYGDLEAIDAVSYPEIDGEFLYIKKVKEKYTQHTRTVTKTVNGKTKVKTETYWTWDVVGREEQTANNVRFLNVDFKTSQFNSPSLDHIKTIKESSRIRYKYYGYPAKSTVTIFAYLSNNNINDIDVNFYNMTIDETIEYLESNSILIFFWVAWIALTGCFVYGFCYLDNKWLND